MAESAVSDKPALPRDARPLMLLGVAAVIAAFVILLGPAMVGPLHALETAPGYAAPNIALDGLEHRAEYTGEGVGMLAPALPGLGPVGDVLARESMHGDQLGTLGWWFVIVPVLGIALLARARPRRLPLGVLVAGAMLLAVVASPTWSILSLAPYWWPVALAALIGAGYLALARTSTRGCAAATASAGDAVVSSSRSPFGAIARLATLLIAIALATPAIALPFIALAWRPAARRALVADFGLALIGAALAVVQLSVGGFAMPDPVTWPATLAHAVTISFAPFATLPAQLGGVTDAGASLTGAILIGALIVAGVGPWARRAKPGSDARRVVRTWQAAAIAWVATWVASLPMLAASPMTVPAWAVLPAALTVFAIGVTAQAALRSARRGVLDTGDTDDSRDNDKRDGADVRPIVGAALLALLLVHAGIGVVSLGGDWPLPHTAVRDASGLGASPREMLRAQRDDWLALARRAGDVGDHGMTAYAYARATAAAVAFERMALPVSTADSSLRGDDPTDSAAAIAARALEARSQLAVAAQGDAARLARLNAAVLESSLHYVIVDREVRTLLDAVRRDAMRNGTNLPVAVLQESGFVPSPDPTLSQRVFTAMREFDRRCPEAFADTIAPAPGPLRTRYRRPLGASEADWRTLWLRLASQVDTEAAMQTVLLEVLRKRLGFATLPQSLRLAVARSLRDQRALADRVSIDSLGDLPNDDEGAAARVAREAERTLANARAEANRLDDGADIAANAAHVAVGGNAEIDAAYEQSERAAEAAIAAGNAVKLAETALAEARERADRLRNAGRLARREALIATVLDGYRVLIHAPEVPPPSAHADAAALLVSTQDPNQAFTVLQRSTREDFDKAATVARSLGQTGVPTALPVDDVDLGNDLLMLSAAQVLFDRFNRLASEADDVRQQQKDAYAAGDAERATQLSAVAAERERIAVDVLALTRKALWRVLELHGAKTGAKPKQGASEVATATAAPSINELLAKRQRKVARPVARRVIDACRLMAFTYLFGLALNEQGQPIDEREHCVSWFKTLLDAEAGTDSVHFYLGVHAFLRRDYGQAIAEYEAELRLAGVDPRVPLEDLEEADLHHADAARGHPLARFELARIHLNIARAQESELLNRWSREYRSLSRQFELPPDQQNRLDVQLNSVEGLNPVPAWALVAAFEGNQDFSSALKIVSGEYRAARNTDPAAPGVREAFARWFYHAGYALWRLGDVVTAEEAMRDAYNVLPAPREPALIIGLPLSEVLGQFYARQWQRLLDDPNLPVVEAEGVWDLLERALRLSSGVRDQLYEFVSDFVSANPSYAAAATELRRAAKEVRELEAMLSSRPPPEESGSDSGDGSGESGDGSGESGDATVDDGGGGDDGADGGDGDAPTTTPADPDWWRSDPLFLAAVDRYRQAVDVFKLVQARILPFYLIGIAIYDDWAKGHLWLKTYYKEVQERELYEEHMLRAVDLLQGNEEWPALLLELGQEYLMWGAQQMHMAREAPTQRIAFPHVQRAAELLFLAERQIQKHIRYTRQGDAVGRISLALAYHEIAMLAREFDASKYEQYIGLAIRNFRAAGLVKRADLPEDQSPDANCDALADCYFQRAVFRNSSKRVPGIDASDWPAMRAAVLADLAEHIAWSTYAAKGAALQMRAGLLAEIERDKGRALFDAGDYAGAITIFEAALELRRDSETYLRLGMTRERVYLESKDTADRDAAIDAYKNALSTVPIKLIAACNLARIYDSIGLVSDRPDAIGSAAKYARQFLDRTDDERSRQVYGIERRICEDIERTAKEAYGEAYNVAADYIKQGAEVSLIRGQLERVLQIYDGNPNDHVRMIESYFETPQDLVKAERALFDARTRFGVHDDLDYLWAVLFVRRDDPRAIKILENYIEKHPDGAHVENAQTYIEIIKNR